MWQKASVTIASHLPGDLSSDAAKLIIQNSAIQPASVQNTSSLPQTIDEQTLEYAKALEWFSNSVRSDENNNTVYANFPKFELICRFLGLSWISADALIIPKKCHLVDGVSEAAEYISAQQPLRHHFLQCLTWEFVYSHVYVLLISVDIWLVGCDCFSLRSPQIRPSFRPERNNKLQWSHSFCAHFWFVCCVSDRLIQATAYRLPRMKS